MATILELLALCVKSNASDLHLSSGMPPLLRINGDMKQIKIDPLSKEDIHKMLYEIMTEKYKKAYEEFLECDFSFETKDLNRFRVNVFNQQRGSAAVFRTIPSRIKTLEELNTPPLFANLMNKNKGLILFKGSLK